MEHAIAPKPDPRGWYTMESEAGKELFERFTTELQERMPNKMWWMWQYVGKDFFIDPTVGIYFECNRCYFRAVSWDPSRLVSVIIDHVYPTHKPFDGNNIKMV